MHDLNTKQGQRTLDQMLRRGDTNAEICLAFGLPTEAALRTAMHRAGLGVETIARKRRLVTRVGREGGYGS